MSCDIFLSFHFFKINSQLNNVQSEILGSTLADKLVACNLKGSILP